MSFRMIKLPREEYTRMKTELAALRRTKLYQRLLEFMGNIKTGKKYTREDIGF